MFTSCCLNPLRISSLVHLNKVKRCLCYIPGVRVRVVVHVHICVHISCVDLKVQFLHLGPFLSNYNG